MKHIYSLQVIICILFVCLFLQNCAGRTNLPLANREDSYKHSGIQAILSKDFVAKGGHLVTFCEQAGELKANVKMNLPKGFSKTYQGLSVALGQGVELARLPYLNEQAQQNYIELKVGQADQPTKVIIYNQGSGLMGGGVFAKITLKNNSNTDITFTIPKGQLIKNDILQGIKDLVIASLVTFNHNAERTDAMVESIENITFTIKANSEQTITIACRCMYAHFGSPSSNNYSPTSYIRRDNRRDNSPGNVSSDRGLGEGYSDNICSDDDIFGY